ncbi:hypothetical protein ACAG96_03575 [Candidatus Izemoplasma sp. B36]|uniref:hypothetical protein n=1 Tax=Candidatus Izemoplasma sp. B36 TaxID=3242468 RepID=UPI00355840E6
MWRYLIAAAMIVFIVGLYVLSYKLNEKTEKPEDCEDLECNSCNAKTCSHRK